MAASMASCGSGWVMMKSVWKLEKYARHGVGDGDGVKAAHHTLKTDQGNIQWMLFHGDKEELVLSLVESHLVISYGHVIQENLSLWNAKTWMRGIRKGDSMLIIYKIKNENRKFRVKFCAADGLTGNKRCEECADQLGKYFNIRSLLPEAQDQQQERVDTKEHDHAILDGEVAIGNLAQALSGQKKTLLPLAYRHCNLPTEHLDTIVRLCVSDSTFPAFVAEVERVLEKITAHGEST